MSIKIKVNFTIADELEIVVNDEYFEQYVVPETDRTKAVIDKRALASIDRRLKQKGIEAFNIALSTRATVVDDTIALEEVVIDEEKPF